MKIFEIDYWWGPSFDVAEFSHIFCELWHVWWFALCQMPIIYHEPQKIPEYKATVEIVILTHDQVQWLPDRWQQCNVRYHDHVTRYQVYPVVGCAKCHWVSRNAKNVQTVKTIGGKNKQDRQIQSIFDSLQDVSATNWNVIVPVICH